MGVDTTSLYHKISSRSLVAALREQNLYELSLSLREILPDILDQYSHELDTLDYNNYWEQKMRGLHAFQMQSVKDSLKIIEGSGLLLADIGDSSGNHGIYIEKLVGDDKVKEIISVNMDETAINKIKEKGRLAVQCRAENIHEIGLKPDLVLTFEILEHLTDPLIFLRRISADIKAKYLLMTVPYRRTSRFGGDLIRQVAAGMDHLLTAEQTHMFELSPGDWGLMARLAGFEPIFTKIYFQYPKKSFWRFTAPIWRHLDFEGFVAILMKREMTISKKYQDWP